jgi:hypothetical protein
MRTVHFEVLPGVGDGKESLEGSLTDLVESTPTLLQFGVIPPLHVLNDVLRRGGIDAGMSGGCKWEPFEIDATEWSRLRTALETGASRYEYVEPPAWVQTYEYWQVWLLELRHGVPAEEHRRLVDEDAVLERELQQALAQGDDDRVLVLHAQRSDVNSAIARLVMTRLQGSREGRAH